MTRPDPRGPRPPTQPEFGPVDMFVAVAIWLGGLLLVPALIVGVVWRWVG